MIREARKPIEIRREAARLVRLWADEREATGDAEGKRPGFTDMVGRAKWDAWDAMKGTSKDDAMQQYVDLIADLKD